MEADFWHERWHKGETGFHQVHAHVALERFWESLGLAPGARVFVPLAGKSRDLVWLAARGYEVLGVELSEIAVREFATENGSQANVDLRCGDLFDLTPSAVGRIDAVFDRASIVALPPAMRQRYTAKLRELTATGCRMLLVTMEYDQTQMRGPPHAVMPEEVHALYGADHDIVELGVNTELADAPRFAARGVHGLTERYYRLMRR